MIRKNRFYVGCTVKHNKDYFHPYTVFTSQTTPTRETHGRIYLYVIGAFITKRGAEFMEKYGHGNPHCQCVADAERLAKR